MVSVTPILKENKMLVYLIGAVALIALVAWFKGLDGAHRATEIRGAKAGLTISSVFTFKVLRDTVKSIYGLVYGWSGQANMANNTLAAKLEHSAKLSSIARTGADTDYRGAGEDMAYEFCDILGINSLNRANEITKAINKVELDHFERTGELVTATERDELVKAREEYARTAPTKAAKRAADKAAHEAALTKAIEDAVADLEIPPARN